MSTDHRHAALRRLLDQPFVGFTPWILLSVVEGPGRVVLAAVLACGLALMLAGAGTLAGLRPKLLDVTAIGFFGALILVAALGGPATQHWLGIWAGEVSNVAIALITIGSIVARRPFTLAYARGTTDPAYWESPLFLRINYAISTVWAVTFLLTAAVGYIGDGLLHQPNNIWTDWIIQIALLILAIKFTAWYPDFATAERPAGAPAESKHKRTALEFARPVGAYLIPVGILVTIVGGNVWWIGAALIVLGVFVTRWLRGRAAATAPTPDRTP